MNAAETLLLSILKAYAGNGPLPSSIELGEEQWEELYRISSEQGVSTLVFGAVAGRGIPFGVKIKWALKAKGCKERHALQVKALQDLSKLCARAGIEPVLLKGHSLSRYYPDPQERECGDIDIYTGADFKRMNDLFEDNSCPMLEEDEKHRSYDFEGITVENHEKLNYALNRPNIIAGNAMVAQMAVGQRDFQEYPGFRLPSPEANALYLMMHTLGHLSWSGIPLRNILDWTFFLQNEGRSVDWALVQGVWKESELAGAAAIINRLAVELLGCDPSCCGPDMGCDDSEYEFVLWDILHPCKDPRKTGNPFRKLYIKTERFKRRQRRHQIIYRFPLPDSFFKDLLP